MELLPVLLEAIEHNYWARDRQLAACAALSEEQFLRPVGGSFPSVRDALAHLMAVEWIWLERWRGRAPDALMAAGDFATLAALAERWGGVERELREWVAGVTEEALEQPLTFLNTRGQEWTYPLWRLIYHLLNHQSYHRGQVTQHLRILGLAAPPVDFLVGRDMEFRSR